jgi:predicted metal-dependent peptidase
MGKMMGKELDPAIKARDAQAKECAITSAQRELWLRVKSKFLWDCPYFSDLFYRLMNPRGTEQVATFTKDIPIAATDGLHILINPDTFFKPEYTLNNRVFITAHEVMHAMFNHPGMMHMWAARGHVALKSGKKLPFSSQLMNIAMDYVINAILIESKVGEFKHGEWLHDPNIAGPRDSVVDVYEKLFKQVKWRKSRGGKGGEDIKGKGFDEVLKPGQQDGKDPTQASQDRSQHEWDTAIAAGMEAAKKQGKLPAGMGLVFGEALEPVVDWTDKIRSFFARKAGTGGYDFRKGDRRLIARDIFAPSQSGHGCGTIVVGVDTSGSIVAEPKTLDRFLAEVSGILQELKPRQLHLVWCDAAVHRADEVDEVSDLNVIRAKGAPGGGGTSFVPVFKWIEQNDLEPEALIYLTDMYGDFPSKAPNYPVLWGSISNGVAAPFGEVVDVPIQE